MNHLLQQLVDSTLEQNRNEEEHETVNNAPETKITTAGESQLIGFFCFLY